MGQPEHGGPASRRRNSSVPPTPTEVDASPPADTRSGAPPVPPALWKWFLALEAAFALVYWPFGVPTQHPLILGFVPWREWPGQVPAWAAIGLSAVAAVVYGVRRYRPRAPVAWWFVGAGVLLFITGDTAYK